MKKPSIYLSFIILGFIFLCSKISVGQNCPALNVIGSFYDLPTGTTPNLATAQSDGLCYNLTPPYPAQVCFEYMVPFSDTVRASFHLAACGSQSSIGTGTFAAGCSGTASTNATFIGQSTYDNSCNLIGNYIAAGYCGGATSGDIITVCLDLNNSSACDPITICPMLFCNTSLCSTTLPIDLLNFEATCDWENTILKWTTTSEINNDYFIIERSSDAYNYNKIGEIQGAGNSNIVNSYSFIDDSNTNSRFYYRLKQVDFDGAFSYSNIIVNKCDFKGFSIHPNPSNGILNINMDDFNDAPVKVFIINSIGEIVLENRLNNASSIINIEYLAKGFYQIQLIDENQYKRTLKFIKQ